MILKEDTLEEQRPHFSHKKVVCTTQVSPSGRRPGQHRPRRLFYYPREFQLHQRRICLVKIARTYHVAMWSTYLTDVHHHVSPTTRDAKLIELLHSMPCPACCVVFSRVTLCHTLTSHVVLSHVKCAEFCYVVFREIDTRHQTHPVCLSGAMSHRMTSVCRGNNPQQHVRARYTPVKICSLVKNICAAHIGLWCSAKKS